MYFKKEQLGGGFVGACNFKDTIRLSYLEGCERSFWGVCYTG